MDCVSPILDVTTRLWDCTAKRALYIRELQENLNSLKSLAEELTNLSKDVLERVEREEHLQRSKRTHEVDGWLHSVQLMQVEVEEILRNGDHEIHNKYCLGGTCPKNCRSSYKLGKMVSKKMVAVTDLMAKGRRFDVVTYKLPPTPVDERPMGKTVGLDLMFQKVRSCLQDDRVSSIGLYGIGGVGKTTLMTKINNEYFGAADFDVVIWVVVSKPVDIEEIQKVILKKLGTPEQELESKGKEEMTTEIFRLLKPKKFAILLDDMWERVDLLEVGIPTATTTQYSSKVVLTTRSERVCDDMQVDKRLRVECLTEDEAFTLFCDNVGENLLNSHPDMTRLARDIVEECRGLPLALVVIGRSMASRKTPRDWEQAIQTLKSYPSMFSGMGDQVFPILKFSYDHLDNDTLKSCFLYCSLFPEDYEISKRELVDLWMGERFLDKLGDLDEARNQAEEIIRSLKLACLLEGDLSDDKCKMHDVIRDMALWISCNVEEEHKIVVLDRVKLVGANEIVKWQEATRISLWRSNIELLSLSPPCFINLQTLILRGSSMKSLPVGFFQNMPVIRVLDLSLNRQLEELPLEICRLESLEYLNLVYTRIEKMPAELKNLTNLRCLILHNLDGGMVIPPNVISCLSNLQILIGLKGINIHEEVGVLEELECLQYLSELGIKLCTISGVKKVLGTSQKLQRCLRSMLVEKVEGLKEVELSLLTLQRLEGLMIEEMDDLEDVKIIDHAGVVLNDHHGNQPRGCISSNSNFRNLRIVVISRCQRILNLNWLIYAPSLQRLWVMGNDKMEEIIGQRVSSSNNNILFSRLESMWLKNLPNLRSIYTGALSFPSLRSLVVSECPNLRKLPLNSSCTNISLEEIKGESKWWEELEWEDDNLKHTFSQYFKADLR